MPIAYSDCETTTIAHYRPIVAPSNLVNSAIDSRADPFRGRTPFNEAMGQLAALREIRAGWDGYCAPAPMETAIAISKTIIAHAIREHSLAPAFVLPSAEGGIGICFRSGRRYADIECFNSGEILALTSMGDGTEPCVWEVDVTPSNLRATFEAIGEHFGRSFSNRDDAKWATS